MKPSSAALMTDRRFWPMFWTQFLGAFNDNVFKNAMVILITFKAYSLGGFSPKDMVAVCGGVFILPFFLFSAISGQLADKWPKNRIVIIVK
ncbi:MAG: MFS transporter, partial [Bdellovibrionia bacterium]